jgi:6-phosphogluconolactonase (cycloisomerase 2 family)
VAGGFVFVGNGGPALKPGGSIAAFMINADGTLTPVEGSPFNTSMRVAVVKGDPQGRFVFVGANRAAPRESAALCAEESSALLVEKVDRLSGALTQATEIGLRGSCVRDIAVDPSGTHLYVGVRNIATSGGAIQSFQIGSGGTLTELPGSPLLVGDLPVSIAMHPSGRFIFAATPDLSVLDRDTATGAVSLRGVFSTPKRQLALNPTGTLLIASERDTGEIAQFAIDDLGNVSESSAEHRRTSLPGNVAADPLGQFFVVSESSDAPTLMGLSTFKQEQPNGGYLRTNAALSGADLALAGVAFDPTGKFFYAVSASSGTVTGYVLDRNTGRLSAIGKAVATGGAAVSITIVQPR